MWTLLRDPSFFLIVLYFFCFAAGSDLTFILEGEGGGASCAPFTLLSSMFLSCTSSALVLLLLFCASTTGEEACEGVVAEPLFLADIFLIVPVEYILLRFLFWFQLMSAGSGVFFDEVVGSESTVINGAHMLSLSMSLHWFYHHHQNFVNKSSFF